MMGNDSSSAGTGLMEILKQRFADHPERHEGMAWEPVEERLRANPEKLATLEAMEGSGGEPDILRWSEEGEAVFYDCAKESPAGRRSLCYDQEALEARKANKPLGSAVGMARELGITLLSEEEYRFLQEKGAFDEKTSSWVETPEGIRKEGGALFCDRRYGAVFLYHNGADSYYGARGFRGLVKI